MCLSISGLHLFSPVRVIMHFGHAGGERKKEDLCNSYGTPFSDYCTCAAVYSFHRFIITGCIMSGVLLVFCHV